MDGAQRPCVHRDLAEGLAAILLRPVGQAERAVAAAQVLDWAACAVAGADSVAGRAHRAAAAAHGPGPCMALGVGRIAAPGAVLANAAPANLLEMDDVDRHAMLHCGPVVVPAALAAAEAASADPLALLDAIVRGDEAMMRVGRAAGPGHYRTWHPTATCGPFGAAAACASVLGLPPAGMAHALRLAGTQASGPWQVLHSANEGKQLHAARAAHAGWLAATLAEAGAAGPLDMLEGRRGFFFAFCPDAQPGLLLEGLEWLVHDLGFKPWPACRHTHAAIDAALAFGAVPEGGIVIETYEAALRMCDNPHPSTPLEARFSLQHAVAVSLLDGPPGLAAFEAFARPDIARLRERITLRLDPVDGTAHPPRFAARVYAAGRCVHVPDALGDPANPLPPGGLVEKARMLLESARHPDPQALIDAALALPSGGSIARFTSLLPTRGMTP